MVTSKGIPAETRYRGEVAQRYDAERGAKKVTSYDHRIVESFLDEIPENSLIGDIPSGTGRFIGPVINKGMKYLGADVSSDMLLIARKKYESLVEVGLRYPDEFRLIQGTAENIDLETGSLDWLLSIKFIKHLPNLGVVERVLSEFCRVVREGAIVQVKIKQKKAVLPLFYKMILQHLLAQKKGSKKVYAYKHREMMMIFDRVGFNVRDIIDNEINGDARFYVLTKKKN